MPKDMSALKFGACAIYWEILMYWVVQSLRKGIGEVKKEIDEINKKILR